MKQIYEINDLVYAESDGALNVSDLISEIRSLNLDPKDYPALSLIEDMAVECAMGLIAEMNRIRVEQKLLVVNQK